jgi:isoquinoline 1-oxidoreductase alpha subunit
MPKLNVNGTEHQIDVELEMPLLWAMREQLGLTGAKYSCGIGICGACLVLVDGEPLASCVTPVSAAEGKAIRTIEGIDGRIADAVRAAWTAEDVPQCGYCQAGQIIAAVSVLSANPAPTDAETVAAMSRVLCRCGTYPAIHRALRRASEALKS